MSVFAACPRSAAPEHPVTLDRAALAVGLVLVAIICAIYAQVLRHDFIFFDDDDYIFRNVYIRDGLTWDGFLWAWTTGYAANWHPLTWLSHMLDIELWGLDPGLHLMTNVAWHAANTLLLAYVLRCLGVPAVAAVVAAALFAVHPLNVESVAWAAQRKSVLSLFFGLLAVVAYTRYAAAPGWRSYLGVVAGLAASLMSKPMLVTLPVLLLVLDFWPLQRWRAPERKSTLEWLRANRALLVEKAPLLGLAVASSVVTVIVQERGGAVTDLVLLPWADRIANVFQSAAAYLMDAVFPFYLCVFHAYDLPLEASRTAQGVAVCVLMTLLVWLGRSHRPWLLAGWIWYAVALLPVIGLLQVGSQAKADRYTYVPLLLLWVAVGMVVERRVAAGGRSALAALGAAAALVAALAVVAHDQARTWRSTESVFDRALAVSGPNIILLNNIAVAYVVAERWQDAEVFLEAAKEAGGDLTRVWNNLGLVYLGTGRGEQAVAAFQESLRLAPNHTGARANLGQALVRAGRAEEALVELDRAAAERPQMEILHYFRGLALDRLGRLPEAERALRQAIALRGSYPEAYNDLGTVLLRLQRPREALSCFQVALLLRPRFPEALFNLASALRVLGQGLLADEAYREALKLQPSFIDARRERIVLLQELGQAEESWQEAERLQALPGLSASEWAAVAEAAARSNRPVQAQAAAQRWLEIEPTSARAAELARPAAH